DAVQNACRDRDDVPACVRKDPGICLRTLDRDQFTRRSWHCVQEPLLEYTIFTDKSSRKFSFRSTDGSATSHRGKSQPNGGEKFLVVEWLSEKSRRASFQRGGTNERIVFSGKHDDARRRRKVPQPRLNFEAIHERHPNINDGYRRPMNLHITQKRVRLAELFGVPTCRHEKPIEASQHRRIIVEETDPIWA